MRNIYLIGFMGCGKSTIAKIMKDHYHMEVIEMDEEIERRERRCISEIFQLHGEEYFRKKETDLLKEISERELCVVSCGGGVILKEENRNLMKESGIVVWLCANPDTILNRVKKTDDRPLLKNKKNVDEIKKMMDKRRPWYEEAAQICIDTDKKSKKEIAEEIMNRIGEKTC